ncbi:DUF4390 domain-containing protein [Ectothiorhodospiraceae bacterium 2226]|nr:DUF4390 domain-containing protein [Ectothiorhodospiraceae bacterium 2226]
MRHPLVLLVLTLAGLALLTAPAFAEEPPGFVVERAEMRLVDRVYVLDSDIRYTLSPDTLGALDMGVPLTIELEIQLVNPRWWWWDEIVAELTQSYQLQHHALTERYVVKNLNSGAQQTFAELGPALEALGRVRDLPLLDVKLLGSGEHIGRVRAALNIEALPAPLRPMAYLSPQWRMSSAWYEWRFVS